MNTLEVEDRLRAAVRASADTVTPDSVPPLRRASFRAGKRRSFGSLGSAWGRWLAPVAAAAAVVAVAVAMVTVGRTMGDRPGGHVAGPSSSSRPGPVKNGPSMSYYVTSGQVPKFFVALESNGNSSSHPTYAMVQATATGQSLGVWTPAGGQTVSAVTAAADDRTFVADVQPWANPNGNANQNFEPRTFYTLVLNQAGILTSVNRVAVSVAAGQLMTGFALSPDGRKLAIAVQPDNNKRETDLTEVKVITLATGATRTWTANGTIGYGPDDARSLSWTAGERTLAFDWEGSGSGIHTGVWLLDLAKGGSHLLANSREAVTLVNQGSSTPLPTVSAPVLAPTSSSPAVTPPTCQEDEIITPGGATIICGAITEVDQTANDGIPTRGAETEYPEYSAASGKVTRVLGHWTFGDVGALSVEVLWSNASGSVLIGEIPNRGTGLAGVISGNEFTPLPGTATATVAMRTATW